MIKNSGLSSNAYIKKLLELESAEPRPNVMMLNSTWPANTPMALLTNIQGPRASTRFHQTVYTKITFGTMIPNSLYNLKFVEFDSRRTWAQGFKLYRSVGPLSNLISQQSWAQPQQEHRLKNYDQTCPYFIVLICKHYMESNKWHTSVLCTGAKNLALNRKPISPMA